ncbi:MAG TPA: hypothetical protein VHN39_00810 [Phenylobacterium sp.]|jgi:hypothetical protein|nr:hypothetical protein [Phenylobacterium sp.]
MRIGVVSLLMMATAMAAGAQPAPAPASAPRDAIADLIDRSVPPPKDEDEPDTAGQPRAAQEPEIDSTVAPQPGPQVPFAPAPRQQLTAPVRIDETGKTPDAPLTVRDMVYDARIRSSFASAESFQGPLDGGWTLTERGDVDRYALQIVDRRDRLEAVWRDLRRAGSLNASGLVDDIQRTGPDLTLRFASGDIACLISLHQGADGRWIGDLARGDQHFTVTLRRTSP